MKAGCWGEAGKQGPLKLSLLPGRVSAPPASFWLGTSCPEVAAALSRLRLSAAALRGWVPVLPRGGRALSPWTAPSRKSATVQMLTIYNRFRGCQSHQSSEQTLGNSAGGRSAPVTYLVGCSRLTLPLCLQGPGCVLYSSFITWTPLQGNSR